MSMLSSVRLGLGGAIPSSSTRTSAALSILRRISSSSPRPATSSRHQPCNTSHRAPSSSSFLVHSQLPSQTRLFSSSPRYSLPRTAPALRKPDPGAPESESGAPSFLSELAKEERGSFAEDAARFRAQTGMAPVRGLRGHTYGHERHSRISSRDHGQGIPSSESSSESPNHGPTPRFREEMLKEDPTFEQPKFEEGIGRPGIWKQIAVGIPPQLGIRIVLTGSFYDG